MCAGVAGGTASGKTSVCTRIIEQLRREIAVRTLLPYFLASAAILHHSSPLIAAQIT